MLMELHVLTGPCETSNARFEVTAMELRVEALVLDISVRDIADWATRAEKAGNVVLAADIRHAIDPARRDGQRAEIVTATDRISAEEMRSTKPRLDDERGVQRMAALLLKICRHVAARIPHSDLSDIIDRALEADR